MICVSKNFANSYNRITFIKMFAVEILNLPYYNSKHKLFYHQ